MMSFKMQIPSLCKQFSFCQQVPEVFSDEKDVDSQFYPKTSDIFQFQHRRAFVSKLTDKELFSIKLFLFCGLNIQQLYDL